MSGRTKKPRRPKPVHFNALARAIEGAQKLPVQFRIDTAAYLRNAREAFLRGQDALANWQALAGSLNTAVVLAENGICSDAESMAVLGAAHEVLGAVWQRQDSGGSWALRAAEIAQLDAALERYAIQLEHCSLREHEAASARVNHVAEQARKGNAAPGVVIYGRV